LRTETKVEHSRLVTAVSGEFRTLQAIGDDFGVTKERIRQLINKLGLQNAPGRQRPKKICPVCERQVESSRKYHEECRRDMIWTTKICGICNNSFSVRTKELALRKANRKTPGVVRTFCSRECWHKSQW